MRTKRESPIQKSFQRDQQRYHPGLLIGVNGLGVRDVLPGTGDSLPAAACGQQAKMSDFDKTFGQQMEQEAAQELRQNQGHSFAAASVGIIFIGEANGLAALIELQQAAWADGDPMSVEGEVAEHLFGASEGPFGVDNPVGSGGLAEEFFK